MEWLETVPREGQYTSAVCIGELFRGAYRTKDARRHLSNIEERVLPAVTALPFDVAVAREYGRLRADLEARGSTPAEADLQIAATALHHDLELVTGNIKHFGRVPRLRISTVLADARQAQGS